MKRIQVRMMAAVVGMVAGVAANADPLFQASFEKGAGDWQASNRASVSEVSRRAGTKSLLIQQWKDEEQNSSWLSPAVKSPGKPVKISFWAADNYHTMSDFSYAACVDVVDYDKDGKQAGVSDYLCSLPWDDARKESMWGKFLPSGLVWRYYERVYAPRGDTFRLKFHWPKQIVRGDCYLTDVVVTEVTADEQAARSAEAVTPAAALPKSNLKLEISLPVHGNLFYRDDPLQAQVLVYSTDQKPFTLPADVKLDYEITDYQQFAIGKGQADWSGAKRVEDESFYKAPVGAKRKENLLKTLVIDAAAAREPGREFFLNVRLSSQGQALAADTVTYGYANPRAIAPADYDKCHFSLNYFDRRSYPAWGVGRKGSVSEKSGTAFSQDYDYYWVRVQPHYPGPYNFGPKRSPFPRMTWCPNIEQERPVEKWIRDEVPPEAIIPDPLHPGRITFQIDPYVEYIVAYIRHHREALARVVPSGLERPIDARTVELAKKVYVAIKKEFPDLPVGFMLYGLPMNPSADVDIFLKEKLYDYCDFIDTHVYAASVDWTEWERLQGEYKKMGRTPPPLVSTEFCRVGGMDQVQKSRDMITAHLDAVAHGMMNLYYFNCINTTHNLPEPFLRGDTDLGGTQTSGFMYMQRIDRPMMAPDLVMEERLKEYRWGGDFGGGSLMPLLQTMTYYNMVQNFEAAAYRKTLHPDDETLAYLFDRADATVAAIWLQKPVGRKTLLVKSPSGLRAQDLFGRTVAMAARDGGVLVSVDENPLTLSFDKKVEAPEFIPMSGGLSVEPVARGAKGEAQITIPAAWGFAGKLRVVCSVDGTWPAIPEQTVSLDGKKETQVRLPFAIDVNRPVGSYPLTARLLDGDKLVGILQAELRVAELLAAEIDTVPMTRTSEPAVTVTLRSFKDTPAEGKIILDDRFFSLEPRFQARAQAYKVPAKGSATFTFPIARSLVNLTTSYAVAARVEDSSGIRFTKEDEVAFRACERAPGPIAVDGDLADWKLDERTAIPFSREMTGYGKPYRGVDDISGVFYTMWDENTLYLAAVIRDDIAVSRANDISLWMDDNLLIGFYPWRWKPGQPLNSGYYREHNGLCADGKARILRCGNVAGGPSNDEGAKIAVKRTKEGYVYELAYDRKSLYPLELKPGGGFRLSLFALDQDLPPSSVGGLSFGGFNENVDARPVKWRGFVFIP